MNYPEIINGINLARVPQRVKGQYEQSDPAQKPSSSVQPIAVLDEQSIEAIKKFVEALNNPRPVKAYTVWNDRQVDDDKITKGDRDVSRF